MNTAAQAIVPFRSRLIAGTIGAWLIYLAVDFLTHGVVMASYWRATAAYWRPPRELFLTIPISYAVFVAYCAALTWLLLRLYGDGLRVANGVRFGLAAGVFTSASFALGAYCIFRMPRSALVYWTASGAVESLFAGGVAAWVVLAARPWRRVSRVLLIFVVLMIVGVVLQNVLFPQPAAR